MKAHRLSQKKTTTTTFTQIVTFDDCSEKHQDDVNYCGMGPVVQSMRKQVA